MGGIQAFIAKPTNVPKERQKCDNFVNTQKLPSSLAIVRSVLECDLSVHLTACRKKTLEEVVWVLLTHPSAEFWRKTN